jgi:hypothetical protein
MWSYAKLGWSAAHRSRFLLLLLFLYQYITGFTLFKYVKATVVPLLHRYPDNELMESASRLFWIEAEFQLTKTDLITPYVWTFAIFLLVRLIVTPVMNSGIYYALTNNEGSQRKAFTLGVKKYAKPFFLLYALQSLLTLAPLLWAVPRALEAASTAYDWTSIALGILPYAAGWMAYQGLLSLVFMHICFGIVGGQSGWAGLSVVIRQALPAVLLALATFAIAGAIGLATAALSLWWAGFLALLIHQTYPLVRTLLKLWAISTQHQLWSDTTKTV